MSTSSTTASPAVTFSGIGSGIDTASIVDALMKIERQPIDRINTQKSALTAKQGVVQEINGLLTTLRDAAAGMYSASAFQGKTATAGGRLGADRHGRRLGGDRQLQRRRHLARPGAHHGLDRGADPERRRQPRHHDRRRHDQRGRAGRGHPPEPGRPHQRHRRRRRLGQRGQQQARVDLAPERQRRLRHPRRHRGRVAGLHHHPARPGRRRHDQRPAGDQRRQHDHRRDQRRRSDPRQGRLHHGHRGQRHGRLARPPRGPSSTPTTP